MYFCLHSSSLHSIAMRRENPSKVHNVWTPSWHPCTYMAECHTGRTLRQLSGSCVNITVAESHFFFLPSQYGDIYTLFFKDRYFVRKTFSLPVFSVAASKLLWHMTLMSLFFKEVDDENVGFFVFVQSDHSSGQNTAEPAGSYCQCCQFVFVR